MAAEHSHPADRLLAAIGRCRAPVCVGIDPVFEKLPGALMPSSRTPKSAVRAIHDFTLGILEAVTGVGSVGGVPCVKFQSACFERYRHHGVESLYALMAEAKRLGLEVILDAKRGDIGVSAEHYAAAAFGDDVPSDAHGLQSVGVTRPDWITINSYLGADGIEPFLTRGGAFALVRTSNPGGDALQSLTLTDGRTVAEAVAQIVADIGNAHIGKSGYSALGAVIGATKRAEAARLRALMPKQIFLVPGYGAQGGGINDVLPCFNRDARGNLTGAIITASRSVIYAFDRDDANWKNAIADAAERFADELGVATGMR